MSSNSRAVVSPETERVTVRVPVEHVDELDALVENDEYPNQSEAVRAFIAEGLNDA